MASLPSPAKLLPWTSSATSSSPQLVAIQHWGPSVPNSTCPLESPWSVHRRLSGGACKYPSAQARPPCRAVTSESLWVDHPSGSFYGLSSASSCSQGWGSYRGSLKARALLRHLRSLVSPFLGLSSRFLCCILASVLCQRGSFDIRLEWVWGLVIRLGSFLRAKPTCVFV